MTKFINDGLSQAAGTTEQTLITVPCNHNQFGIIEVIGNLAPDTVFRLYADLPDSTTVSLVDTNTVLVSTNGSYKVRIEFNRRGTTFYVWYPLSSTDQAEQYVWQSGFPHNGGSALIYKSFIFRLTGETSSGSMSANSVWGVVDEDNIADYIL
jgi:hypothetical protein